ncbi:MAG: Flp pilus assembly complex ATPase component TadA [Campylobacterales bacterium]
MITQKIRLGDLLRQRGALSEEQLTAALAYAKEHGVQLGQAVILMGLATEEVILGALADQFHLNFIDLETYDIDYRLTEKVPIPLLRRYNAIPISEDDEFIYLVTNDPLNLEAQDAIQRLFPRKPIRLLLAKNEQVQRMIGKLALSENIKGLIAEIRRELTTTQMTDTGESSSILRLIQVIIETAISSRSSDIHIEPTQKSCLVRCRIDGMLNETFAFDVDIYPPLSSRLKLLSSLDIAERRKPQDGRFSMTVAGREYDFRISTLPTVDGESIVMRVLDKSKVLIKLEDAGMGPASYERFTKALKAPYGIILVTGPTGSGKTTTLYGALNAVKSVEKKIITVEDPVEYRMNMIQQVQVNEKAGLTFAGALRSILRQDPDTIMIGEIRDEETLRIAIQAALTGHLVLSTLHTNDAISAITRILDIGIEAYLVSGALVAIEAQRLVRKVCPHCAEEAHLPITVFEEYGHLFGPNPIFKKGVGCTKCAHSGYLGREMVSEVLTVSDKIAHLIARNAIKEEILRQALDEGFESMLVDGMRKVSQGITTVEEVLRVTKE